MHDVAVSIEGKRYRFWSEIEITLSLDTFDAIALKAPFEPDNPGFRETFRPFTFKPIDVDIDGERLFTGTMVGVDPDIDATKSEVAVTGYSLPGVLNDCPPPGDEVPYEFEGLKLKDIARSLAQPFGIDVRIVADQGDSFKKVSVEEGQQIFGFLSGLARQRNLVWTSDRDGVLLCWQSVQEGSPVAEIVDDGQPIPKVSATFDPQAYFSEITGFAATKHGRKGSKYTEQNPHLTGRLRPMSFRVEDTDPADAPTATRAKLGRMFANTATWTLADIPTWLTPSGQLWAPNTTVLIKSPRAMIYNTTELLIRTVKLKQTANTETATLEMVLPGAFRGEAPDIILPWDG